MAVARPKQNAHQLPGKGAFGHNHFDSLDLFVTTLATLSDARVLVAGGTGIVGSGVVQAIVKQGIKVSYSGHHVHPRGFSGPVLKCQSLC